MECRFLALTVLLSCLSFGVQASNVWTVNCGPLTVQQSDPIVSPGKPSGHVHAVVGSTAFSRTMSGIDGAANGKATTCDKYTDHSSYWAPQAYQILDDGQYQMLPFTGAVIYYTNYSCDYDASAKGRCPQKYNSKAFPPGLRMIAGNAMRRTFDKTDPWQAAILFENGNNGEVYGMPKTLDGGRLSGHARFPSCWNGKDIDSADHQSHMAYPDATLGGNTQGGMCPESHPVAIFNIGAEFGWDLKGVTDPSKIIFANNDKTGYGFHADFYQGWKDLSALQNSFNMCNSASDCPWFSFGAPGGIAPHPTAMDPETPAPVQNIGQNGPIPALPGISGMSMPATPANGNGTTGTTSAVASGTAKNTPTTTASANGGAAPTAGQTTTATSMPSANAMSTTMVTMTTTVTATVTSTACAATRTRA